jgi:hypothetical protein
MPRPKALNKQPAMTRWTAKPKSEGDSDALTDDEYRKRYGS